MNKFLKILGLVLVIAASVAAYFTDIPTVNYIELAVGALGLALTISATWNKSEKKSWKEIVTIVLFAVGAFLLGFTGVAEGTLTTLITAVAGVVALVAGLVLTFINKPKTVDSK